MVLKMLEEEKIWFSVGEEILFLFIWIHFKEKWGWFMNNLLSWRTELRITFTELKILINEYIVNYLLQMSRIARDEFLCQILKYRVTNVTILIRVNLLKMFSLLKNLNKS